MAADGLMVQLSSAQERTYRAGLAVARNQAEAERITFMFLTESNGRNAANDGKAFHPDPAKRRPGWDKDDKGRPLPLQMIEALYRELRKSLELPHDVIGNNGGSTGPAQQLSQTYVAIRFPGSTWGYGSIADTMNLTKSATMFRDRLRVTNNPVYAGITFSDPLVADVLRVQQPLVSEHESDNYNAAQVATAKAIVTQLTTPEPSPGDILEDLIMADRGVILIVKSQDKMWLTWPLSGLKMYIQDMNMKNAFVQTLKRNNVPVVEDLAGDEWAYLQLLTDIRLVHNSIVGGYPDPNSHHNNNIAGIWYRTEELAKKAGINTKGL